MDKTIVLVVLLFLIVSSTNINANVNKISIEQNSDITIQIFGIKNVEDYAIQLTSEEENSLKELFEDFKIQLDNSEDREKRINLFKEMIVSLDNLGLIPEGVTVEELQQLVTTKLIKQKNIVVIKNFNSLITGRTSHTRFFKSLIESTGKISFGDSGRGAYSTVNPSNGWVFTDGSNGVVKFNGKMYGIAGDVLEERQHHIGAEFFKGIGIIHGQSSSFLGVVQNVEIKQYEIVDSNDISKKDTSTNFLFARITGTAGSYERKESGIEIFGDLTLFGFGTVCRLNGCTTGFQTAILGYVSIPWFICKLNNNEVNGIGFSITG